ncbi:porin [Crocinitomix algicola]|uniref:porin n=1 Tax=Crocinitomix algicola TaxID=1740263 RepID=UPI0008309E5C|nr:porin [Crocinitomix algicola]
MRIAFTGLLFFLGVATAQAQYVPKTFGKGINFIGKDSTFSMKFGIRFQTLMMADWTVSNDQLDKIGQLESNFLLRRSRLKFNGFAFLPSLKYKVELGLSNRDIGGGTSSEYSNAPRFILDAYLDWNFYQNFTLRVGQSKLPGNRERVISSGDLALVDRSLLNSRYNIDRDIGLQLKHHFTFGKNFLVREIVAFSQGEGRNITVGNIGGYEYTFRLEMLPFGKFDSKGDYVGGGLTRPNSPKLAVGVTYDINEDAPRQRGQGGHFIKNLDGSYAGETLYTFFGDLMFKYKGLSVMVEYAHKTTEDGTPSVFDKYNENFLIGRHYTGKGVNVQAGWLFKNNYELTTRFTQINPNSSIEKEEKEYTIGLSKYIVGHKLKVQTDLSYRSNSNEFGDGVDDQLFWRVQVDLHF